MRMVSGQTATKTYQSVLWTAVLAAIVAMYSVLLGSLMNLILVSKVFFFSLIKKSEFSDAAGRRVLTSTEPGGRGAQSVGGSAVSRPALYYSYVVTAPRTKFGNCSQKRGKVNG